MSWWSIIKIQSNVKEIGDEQTMKIMWDNKWNYPIENWYGAFVNENGKERLVTVVGNSVRTGKEGKQYAYVGGGKTHPDYRGEDLFRLVREKAVAPVLSLPRMAGFSNMRKKKGLEITRPQSHAVIPDDVLRFMEERMEHLPNVVDWGIIEPNIIIKWEYLE